MEESLYRWRPYFPWTVKLQPPRGGTRLLVFSGRARTSLNSRLSTRSGSSPAEIFMKNI